MLDLVGIVFSGIMMLFVVFRAVQLDAVRPWFETAPPEPEPGPAAQGQQRPGARPLKARPVQLRDTHR